MLKTKYCNLNVKSFCSDSQFQIMYIMLHVHVSYFLELILFTKRQKKSSFKRTSFISESNRQYYLLYKDGEFFSPKQSQNSRFILQDTVKILKIGTP